MAQIVADEMLIIDQADCDSSVSATICVICGQNVFLSFRVFSWQFLTNT